VKTLPDASTCPTYYIDSIRSTKFGIYIYIFFPSFKNIYGIFLDFVCVTRYCKYHGVFTRTIR